MRVFPQRQYFTDLSEFWPFERVPVCPVYFDPWAVCELIKTKGILDNLFFGTSALGEDYSLPDAYRRAVDSAVGSAATDAIPSDVFNSLSMLGVRARSPVHPGDRTSRRMPVGTVALPIERFFCGDHLGSGRHARVGEMEFKGVGRNCCSGMSDWKHAWGGLMFDSLLEEIMQSQQISSSSPLGAVPMFYGGLYAEDDSPLVFRVGSSDGEEYALLGYAGRCAKYTRLANLPVGHSLPMPDLSAIPSMIEVIDQYAALVANGYLQFSSILDNLTIEGYLIDTASTVYRSEQEWMPFIGEKIIPRKRPLTGMADIVEELASSRTDFRYVSSVAGTRHALSSISQMREKLSLDGLPSGWEHQFIDRVAYFWLKRNGFYAGSINDVSSAVRDRIEQSYACGTLSKEAYLRSRTFSVVCLDQEAERIDVMLVESEAPNVDELLQSISTESSSYSKLIRTYNRRKLTSLPASISAEMIANLSTTNWLEMNSVINYTVAINRWYHPDSRNHKDACVSFHSSAGQILIESPMLFNLISAIMYKGHSAEVLAVRLRNDMTLERIYLQGELDYESRGIRVQVPTASELILEGLIFQTNGVRALVVPLPVQHWSKENVRP